MRSRWLLLLLATLLIAACGQQSTTGGGPVTPVFAFTEAVVGPNRIALGLVRNGSPVNDPGAKIHLRFFDLNDTSSPVKIETDAVYYGQGLPAAIYVAYPTFDRAGNWGIEVQTTLSGQSEPNVARLRLEVKERSEVPNVGDRAISVKTPTVRDVPDPSRLSSGRVEDLSMYQISLDEALQNGKPTALLFATPAFCRTAVCAPSLSVMQQLQKIYGDRINFIHVEVFRYPFRESFEAQTAVFQKLSQEGRAPRPEERNVGLSDPMIAWGLQSEPWLYLIDANGVIVARYEGGITREEMTPALENLIAGKPPQDGR
ncbi:TlpA family protein disulfide reductase [Roseiflexus castenholzii]|uniref:TlpA family protein disulfide reductase n=1 Tax=Roseiflexus castenholzii TaxID=120962 RepID=UPI003C7B6887